MRLNKTKSWAYLFAKLVAISVMAFVNLTGIANAKSLYLAAEHHIGQFDAWNINPDGTIVKQATYALQYATDPAGIAIDNDSNTLFITSEFSPGVEIVDPVTLTYLGQSTGPNDLAGIDVDDINNIVYAIQRNTNILYIFQWDSLAKTLTQIDMKYLPDTAGAFGLSLDEFHGILWVADTAGGEVRAYNLNTWTEDTNLSFIPSHKPVDVSVDRVRNLVYSVSIVGGAAVPPGTGSNLLSKFDLNNRTETTIDMGYGGVGVAVDEVTGYVYVTGGANIGDNISVWDTTTSPFTKIQDTGPIGNPAGIAIGNVSYNPLNLAKNDIIQGQGVYIGSNFTYEITFNSPTTTQTGVSIVDTLPTELDFISATDGGVYDSTTHTVTWNLGTISAGQPVPTIHLEVRVNQNAQPNSTIYNYCTINGDHIPPTTVIDQDPDNPTGEPGLPVLPNIPVAVDIHPTSCPNPLNTDSRGMVPVAILGGSNFDVKHIDPKTIQLKGVDAIRPQYADVATPYEPFLGKQSANDCNELGSDGYLDLTFRVRTQDLVDAIGDVEDKDVVVVPLTANLKQEYGGTPIVGEDVVVIIDKDHKHHHRNSNKKANHK